MAAPQSNSWLLLSASSAHLAELLRQLYIAAPSASAGLQPSTDWPACTPLPTLWAMAAEPAALAIEDAWRTELLHGRSPRLLHLLHGSSAQQVAQIVAMLTPARPSAPAPTNHNHGRGLRCSECLDADSEQKLFSRLTQDHDPRAGLAQA